MKTLYFSIYESFVPLSLVYFSLKKKEKKSESHIAKSKRRDIAICLSAQSL